MSTFGTGDQAATNMPGTSSQMTPGNPQGYGPPELSIGNVTSLKKPGASPGLGPGMPKKSPSAQTGKVSLWTRFFHSYLKGGRKA